MFLQDKSIFARSVPLCPGYNVLKHPKNARLSLQKKKVAPVWFAQMCRSKTARSDQKNIAKKITDSFVNCG